MLDDLGTAMLNTETKMDNVMKKIAKISKLDDGMLLTVSLRILEAKLFFFRQ